MCTALVGVYYPEQPYQVNQMQSSTNPYGALLDDAEESSDDRRSQPQPRPRPLRTLTPNTRTAYAARASARRAALRDNIPEERLATSSFAGPRPSFADVLAGVAATAAPQPQISTDAPRSAANNAPSLGDLAAQQGANAEPTPPTAPPMAIDATEAQ